MKSDPVDAVAAARAAQSGQAAGQPKTRNGAVEVNSRLARGSSLGEARPHHRQQPDARAARQRPRRGLRETLRGSTVSKLVTTAARFRPADPTTAAGATRFALRDLARRVQSLDAESKRLDDLLESLVSATAPELVASYGVGTDTAGELLVSAGDNPERLRSEAAFAHLCGVAPIDASSGLTSRKRLNLTGATVSANHALWRIVMVRMVFDARTRAYVTRRTAGGSLQARDHPLAQALRRPRALPLPASPSNRLTIDRSIGAVWNSSKVNTSWLCNCSRRNLNAARCVAVPAKSSPPYYRVPEFARATNVSRVTTSTCSAWVRWEWSPPSTKKSRSLQPGPPRTR